jgi:LemA protein
MLIALIVLALLVFAGVTLYNRLVGLRNRSENAWSDIDVQLKRRHELIPNLVETVKGYASHEQKTLQGVTEARTRAMQGGAPADRARAEGELSRSIGALFALAEAYPQLRANESFVALQGQLASLEEAIQNARRYYNAIVRDLNTATETFPSNLVANGFGFSRREYFELDSPAEGSVPKVSFGA